MAVKTRKNLTKTMEYMHERELTPKARLLYLALKEMDRKGVHLLGNDRLERLTGVQRTGLWYARKELAEKGLIEYRKKGREGTVYKVYE